VLRLQNLISQTLLSKAAAKVKPLQPYNQAEFKNFLKKYLTMINAPTRLDISGIDDARYLSQILELVCYHLQYHHAVTLYALAFDTGVPEVVWRILLSEHRHEVASPEVHAADYHMVFEQLLLVYPKIQLWLQDEAVFVQM
jgi:hypothetical protein